MCRSAAEGGQRCASHANARYLAAKEAYRVAAMDYMHGRESNGQIHLDAFAAARQARIEYASTPQGEAELTTLAEQGHRDAAEDIAKGLELRARNAEVRRQARRGAARSALMRAARDRVTATGHNRAWMHAAETKVLHARFDQFTLAAEENPSLRAPASFAADAKDCAARAGVGSLGREATYGLWRAQRTGADFAPPAPDGSAYTPTVTSWDDLRPGDVIDTPGTRSPADVAHEGKVVASTTQAGAHTVVAFTDGTDDVRARSVFTVLRPYTPEDEVALDRYNQTLDVATITGRDERGHWAADPHTGDVHYRP